MDKASKENEQCNRLGKIFVDRDSLLDEHRKAEDATDEVRFRKESLLDILCMSWKASAPSISSAECDSYKLTGMKQPYMVIGKVSLIAVFNFGVVKRDNTNFHRENIVRPVNYKAKRLYYAEPGRGFAFYTCRLTSKKNMPNYSVTTEDGWRLSGGRAIFAELAKKFSLVKFKNIDDFFGLTDPNIQKIILEMPS